MLRLRDHWTDYRLEQVLGNLLRAGVVVAGLIVLIGGLLLLVQDGAVSADHHTFHSVAPDLRGPVGIFHRALSFDSRGLIQLGLLILVGTPVARVLFCLVAFLFLKDRLYVAVTLIVLVVLVYSLFCSC